MKNFFTNLHYKKEPTLSDKMLISLLLPFSSGYALIADIRNFLYKIKVLKTYTPEILTISIGNLTTGGTGKTPITAKLANHLTQKGYKVAILSRGYGSKLNSKEINIISDGKQIYYDAQTGGDEPVWLSQNCPHTMVLTSSNRVQIAKYAEKQGCSALILDDGFQHQKLRRKINIAVVDIEKQFGNKKTLPAGPLRENYKNIKRANNIIIVNKNIQLPKSEELEFFKNELSKLNKNAKISLCNAIISEIYDIHSKNKLENIEKKKILAFSAIGQPQQFYKLLKQNNANIIKTIDFADHHQYTENDINDLFKIAKQCSCDELITTEKDAVKIKNLTQKTIYALKLDIDWDAETIF